MSNKLNLHIPKNLIKGDFAGNLDIYYHICIVLSFQGAIYGLAQSIPDRSMVSEIVGLFLDACYSTKDPEQADRSNGVPNGKGVH